MVRDIGRYILPVICGLLVTTSVSMLNASAEARVGAPVAAVLWLSIAGTVLATIVRHRRIVPDVVLLLACGSASLGGLLATWPRELYRGVGQQTRLAPRCEEGSLRR